MRVNRINLRLFDDLEPVPEGEQLSEKPIQEERESIGVEEIREAFDTLQKYKAAKSSLEARIKSNEEWWKMQHWDEIKKSGDEGQDSTTAWLFNTICNKHADTMDNYPEPSILPRAEDDEETARTLSKIIPVVLEMNDYEQVYSDTNWYKQKQGTGVNAVLWNKTKLNGLGDIDIKKVDLLNLFWEPGKADIQDSDNVFLLSLEDSKKLKSAYPVLKDAPSSSNIEIVQYNNTNEDTTDKCVVVDWYYKRMVGTRTVLHFVKFVGETILYASENDTECKEKGFYAHGMYPFVVDTLFPEEDNVAGFGYIDAMKCCQTYIDKLNQTICENALISSKKRWLIDEGCSINETEFADTSKTFVHVTGGRCDKEHFMEIAQNTLPAVYVNILQSKIDELKETSGNRDFAQGCTSGGVTAASAIAALMEAGSKMSRDQNKSAYRAMCKMVNMIVELIRQFYDVPRMFRITGRDNTNEYVSFDNDKLRPQPQGDVFGSETGYRLPVFDIVITAAKKSTYSRLSQNELALQFYNNGFFNPQMADQALMCIEMMDFDGKEKIIQKIQEGKQLYQQNILMQMMSAKPRINAQDQLGQSQAEKAGENAREVASVG